MAEITPALQRSPIGRLSQELRDNVWTLVVAVLEPFAEPLVLQTEREDDGERRLRNTTRNNIGSDLLTLTATCKQIRTEVHKVFLSKNHFEFKLAQNDIWKSHIHLKYQARTLVNTFQSFIDSIGGISQAFNLRHVRLTLPTCYRFPKHQSYEFDAMFDLITHFQDLARAITRSPSTENAPCIILEWPVAIDPQITINYFQIGLEDPRPGLEAMMGWLAAGYLNDPPRAQEFEYLIQQLLDNLPEDADSLIQQRLDNLPEETAGDSIEQLIDGEQDESESSEWEGSEIDDRGHDDADERDDDEDEDELEDLGHDDAADGEENGNDDGNDEDEETLSDNEAAIFSPSWGFMSLDMPPQWYFDMFM